MQSVDVSRSSAAHEGKLGEGRAQDVAAKMRIAAEHEAEDRHEQQQQGEKA